MQPDRCKILWLGLLMDTPHPPIEIPASDETKTFIAVIDGCVPSGDREKFTSSVQELLSNNGINEEPRILSSYGCTFAIDLRKEQFEQLSRSEKVTLSSDHNLSIH